MYSMCLFLWTVSIYTWTVYPHVYVQYVSLSRNSINLTLTPDPVWPVTITFRFKWNNLLQNYNWHFRQWFSIWVCLEYPIEQRHLVSRTTAILIFDNHWIWNRLRTSCIISRYKSSVFLQYSLHSLADWCSVGSCYLIGAAIFSMSFTDIF